MSWESRFLGMVRLGIVAPRGISAGPREGIKTHGPRGVWRCDEKALKV